MRNPLCEIERSVCVASLMWHPQVIRLAYEGKDIMIDNVYYGLAFASNPGSRATLEYAYLSKSKQADCFLL